MTKRIITLLIKKGNKNAVMKMMVKVCETLLQTFPGVPLSYLFSLLFLRLYTHVEIRRITYRRKVHFIPVPVKQSRKLYIIFKWLITAVSAVRLKKGYSTKLYSEIFSVIINNPSSRVIKLKEENEIKARNYRSKIHFRWN
jgi:ribosomal protein S7